MKINNDIGFTYNRFLHSACYAKDTVDICDIQPMLENFSKFNGLGLYGMPLFFVVDYTNRNYMFLTDSVKLIFGYDAREFIESGIGFFVGMLHKDYFDVHNKKTFPSTLNFLKKTPTGHHQDYLFSFNNLVKIKQGTWINLFQRSIYITSEQTGMPLYSLTMALDITDIKKDNEVVQTIHKIDNLSGTQSLVEANYYYPFQEDALLTNSEKNILKYMADGLSTKMVAGRLNISDSTVSNHRQNMMRKTNTKNAAQLIAYALQNQII